MTDIIIPSSPADLKKLKEGIDQITDSMTRMDAEREYQKESIDELAEKFDIKAKYIRRMAKEAHKDTFEQKVDEEDSFQTLYETVMKS